MNEARPLQTLSDRSDRSDGDPAPCPTCPTEPGTSRTDIVEAKQPCPTGPTCPTDIEGGAIAAPPADPCGLEALDAFEDRAATRAPDGDQPRATAEAATLAEVAEAAGMTPEALQRLWAAHRDARAYLLAHLMQHGPATVGAAGSALGWDATRELQAEARLRAAGLVARRPLGQAHPVAMREPDRIGLKSARFSRESSRAQIARLRWVRSAPRPASPPSSSQPAAGSGITDGGGGAS